jgi:hypothetical protein
MNGAMIRFASIVAIGVSLLSLTGSRRVDALVFNGCTAECPAQYGCHLCDTKCWLVPGGTLSACMYKCDGSACGPGDHFPEE